MGDNLPGVIFNVASFQSNLESIFVPETKPTTRAPWVELSAEGMLWKRVMWHASYMARVPKPNLHEHRRDASGVCSLKNGGVLHTVLPFHVGYLPDTTHVEGLESPQMSRVNRPVSYAKGMEVPLHEIPWVSSFSHFSKLCRSMCQKNALAPARQRLISSSIVVAFDMILPK